MEKDLCEETSRAAGGEFKHRQPATDSPQLRLFHRHALSTFNGQNWPSLPHKPQQNVKEIYVQDHHWQTLIILVGSFIYFIYIYL